MASVVDKRLRINEEMCREPFAARRRYVFDLGVLLVHPDRAIGNQS